MKLRTILATSLGGVMTLGLCGRLNAAVQNNAPPANLPAGHPSIGGQGGLPAGHPAVPGQGAGQLPSGHPDVGGNPTTRPAAKFGTIVVRAYQATANAPALTEAPVSLLLYHRGEMLRKLEGSLDGTGTAVFQRLPLDVPFQPLIVVSHGGVEYQAIGDILDPYNPGGQIEVPVYETVETEPAWIVAMRHVIVEPSPSGVRVTEMVGIFNPGDRSWIGAAQKDGKRLTLALPIPPGVEKVDLPPGAAEAGARVEKGRILNSAALKPGVTQFQFSYVLNGKNNQVRLELAAPADVQHMMVLVSDNGAAVAAEGLKPSGKHDIGNGKALVFAGNELKRGHKAVFVITLPKPVVKQHALGEGGAGTVKVVAGVGGVGALAVGTGYVLFKPAAKAARS